MHSLRNLLVPGPDKASACNFLKCSLRPSTTDEAAVAWDFLFMLSNEGRKLRYFVLDGPTV